MLPSMEHLEYRAVLANAAILQTVQVRLGMGTCFIEQHMLVARRCLAVAFAAVSAIYLFIASAMRFCTLLGLVPPSAVMKASFLEELPPQMHPVA